MVLVSLSCYNKIPQSGWLKHGHLLPHSFGAKTPISRHTHGWFLLSSVREGSISILSSWLIGVQFHVHLVFPLMQVYLQISSLRIPVIVDLRLPNYLLLTW